MIETRTITIDRVEHDHSRAVALFCGSDGSAYWVSYADMARCLPGEAAYLRGARCLFELVGGRWTLARVELPK